MTSECCAKRLQIINGVIDVNNLTEADCRGIFDCILDHGTVTQFVQLLQRLDFSQLTATQVQALCAALQACDFSDTINFVTLIENLDATEQAALCQAIEDAGCVNVAINELFYCNVATSGTNIEDTTFTPPYDGNYVFIYGDNGENNGINNGGISIGTAAGTDNVHASGGTVGPNGRFDASQPQSRTLSLALTGGQTYFLRQFAGGGGPVVDHYAYGVPEELACVLDNAIAAGTMGAGDTFGTVATAAAALTTTNGVAVAIGEQYVEFPDGTTWATEAGAAAGVNSVTGKVVDNTDPANPVIKDWIKEECYLEPDNTTFTQNGALGGGRPALGVETQVVTASGEFQSFTLGVDTNSGANATYSWVVTTSGGGNSNTDEQTFGFPFGAPGSATWTLDSPIQVIAGETITITPVAVVGAARRVLTGGVPIFGGTGNFTLFNNILHTVRTLDDSSLCEVDTVANTTTPLASIPATWTLTSCLTAEEEARIAELVEENICDRIVTKLSIDTSALTAGADASAAVVGATLADGDSTNTPSEAVLEAWIAANVDFNAATTPQATLALAEIATAGATDWAFVTFAGFFEAGTVLSWSFAGEGYVRLYQDECSCGQFENVASKYNTLPASGGTQLSYTVPTSGYHTFRLLGVDVEGSNNTWVYDGDAITTFAPSSGEPVIELIQTLVDCDGNVTDMDGNPIASTVVDLADYQCPYTSVKADDIAGDLFTVSTGPDGVVANATQSAGVAAGENVHFWSNNDSINIDVQEGSALVDLSIHCPALGECFDCEPDQNTLFLLDGSAAADVAEVNLDDPSFPITNQPDLVRSAGSFTDMDAGLLYAIRRNSNQLWVYDVNNLGGGTVQIITLTTTDASPTAFTAAHFYEGFGYGATFSANLWNVYRIDVATGDVSFFNGPWTGSIGSGTSMAINPLDGRFYVTGGSGEVYEISNTAGDSGAVTLIGTATVGSAAGATFDDKGNLYLANGVEADRWNNFPNGTQEQIVANWPQGPNSISFYVKRDVNCPYAVKTEIVNGQLRVQTIVNGRVVETKFHDVAGDSFAPSAFRFTTFVNGSDVNQPINNAGQILDNDLRNTPLDIATNGDLTINAGTGGYTVNTAGVYKVSGFALVSSSAATDFTAIPNVLATGQGDQNGSREVALPAGERVEILYDALVEVGVGDVITVQVGGLPGGGQFEIESYTININKVA